VLHLGAVERGGAGAGATALLGVVAGVHAVEHVDEHGGGGEEAEADVGGAVEGAEEEDVEEHRRRGHPRHGRDAPQLRPPRLRHQRPERADRRHGGRAARREEPRPGAPRRRELPQQREAERHEREGGEEHERRPRAAVVGVVVVGGDVAAVDDGVGDHVEDEERADGDEVEQHVELREQRQRRPHRGRRRR
ncbi:Os11g0155425, partial [Oryza sativa Japonica Group]